MERFENNKPVEFRKSIKIIVATMFYITLILFISLLMLYFFYARRLDEIKNISGIVANFRSAKDLLFVDLFLSFCCFVAYSGMYLFKSWFILGLRDESRGWQMDENYIAANMIFISMVFLASGVFLTIDGIYS